MYTWDRVYATESVVEIAVKFQYVPKGGVGPDRRKTAVKGLA